MKTQNKYSNIFNKDFYPTPDNVLDSMLIDSTNKTVLEPSAGKGNIIDYLYNQGAKSVYFCEINPELAEICKTKGKFLDYDFFKLTAEDIPHIELIVMNPPFSEFKKHFLHAWRIAPEGCQIICLGNNDTITRYYDDSKEGEEIRMIVTDYGFSDYLGDCFNTSNAERRTETPISCINVHKPVSFNNINFDGFHYGIEPEQMNENGVVKFNEIQAIINSYLSSLKEFRKLQEIKENLNTFIKPLDDYSSVTVKLNYNSGEVDENDFRKTLLRRCWRIVFDKTGISKFLTSNVMKDVDVFIEKQSHMPFTMKNIFRMLDILFGTREHNLKKALVTTIDELTKHTHENRYGVQGWKTNDGHLLNKKFIMDYLFRVEEYGSNKGKISISYSSYATSKLNDLVTVLNNITGYDYNKGIDEFVRGFGALEPGKWYCWGYFEIKGFKKGSVHLKFNDLKVWEQLNREYGKAKGMVLPEKI